ncbi:carbon storage regulator CsrA [bacterium]|nr:carbon storage regulator CsrA [bacterium]MBU1154176.1 carbon storage regulator CsrA [bacterium]MBU2599405.1 carbon storage regulator CsrA [bacterium]
MLVLARKRDQSIMIGDNVEIVVVDIHGDQIKLGIKAPRHVAVHRKEVYEEVQKENIRAAGTKTAEVSKLDLLLKKKIENKRKID